MFLSQVGNVIGKGSTPGDSQIMTRQYIPLLAQTSTIFTQLITRHKAIGTTIFAANSINH